MEKTCIIDEKTCVKNYDAFMVEFESFIDDSIKNCSDLSLVILDIDNLSVINHNFGVLVGDKVVLRIVKYLSDNLPANAYLYRYNGDQFAVIFLNTEKESAYLAIERIRTHFHESNECRIIDKADLITCSFSAGVSCCPEDGVKAGNMIRRAHGALLRSKIGGKNKVSLSKVEKFVSRKSLYTTEQLHQLATLSKKLNISEGILLREAIDDLLKKYDK